ITLISSGLLYKSTSRISKSMPFSNKTKRQRWENGQVVPEYNTIMVGLLKIKKSGLLHAISLREAQAPPCGAKPKQFIRLLDIFPVGGVESPGENSEYTEEQQNPDPDTNARVLNRLAHPLQI